MKNEQRKPKAGDRCPYCRQGILQPSPSGHHLMCRSCGRVTVIKQRAKQVSKTEENQIS